VSVKDLLLLFSQGSQYASFALKQARTHASHAHTHTRFFNTSTHTHTHITRARTHIHTHANTRKHAHMHAYSNKKTHLHTHTHKHTHTHTHTHRWASPFLPALLCVTAWCSRSGTDYRHAHCTRTRGCCKATAAYCSRWWEVTGQ